MTEDDRSGLLDNAIKFLQDPQVRNSNLSKQLSFLESKGLSKEEIDEAMRRAGVVKSAVTPTEYSPPPLPVGPPPNSKRIVESGFNWGKFLVILAVIGSTSMALSQSVIMVYARQWLNKIKGHLLPKDQDEKVLNEISRLREEQKLIEGSIKEIREKMTFDLEAIKTTQNYLYRELCNELEELREEIKAPLIVTKPIEINHESKEPNQIESPLVEQM